MKPNLPNSWESLLSKEWEKPYFQKLSSFVKKEYQCSVVYPQMHDIFNALKWTDFHEVKAVILGQDPYHGPNQAHGLSFSVKHGERIPPSLRNIYKEIQNDLGYDIPNHGCIEKWSKEGVLLLNTVLTVKEGEANSHRGVGWETFTDSIISLLNSREKPVVFILWGKPAQNKMKLIDTTKHICLSSAHPSPLSATRGFFGSKPFSNTNHILKLWGEKEIDWKIPHI